MNLPTAGWTAIVPLKPPGNRKTRLAPHLTAARRDALSEVLFAHVVAVLDSVAAITGLVLLSAARPGWRHRWIADAGRGLNAELRAARDQLAARNLLVIHADLPLLTAADIENLLAAAAAGCAVAPDRHGKGTNAIALMDQPGFDFAFGDNSFARHAGVAVRRPGLMLDIDVFEDLELAIQSGFEFEV